MNTTITITPPQVPVTNWLQALRAAVSRRRQAAASSADPGLRDAAAVRELAFSYRESDPGFAADLYAAADRYEWALEAQHSGTPR
jgi:hypothetical protein